MGIQVTRYYRDTAFGLALVTVICGTFAPMFLSINVSWARSIGLLLASLVGICAVVALGLVALIVHSNAGKTHKPR